MGDSTARRPTHDQSRLSEKGVILLLRRFVQLLFIVLALGVGLVSSAGATTDAPTIEIYSPSSDGTYFPGHTDVAYYVCSSAVTYIASCEGDVPLFAPIDVSTAGEHTFTV